MVAMTPLSCLFRCVSLLAVALVSPTGSSTVCSGTEEFLDGQNVLQFEGCERVNGNLIINQLSTASVAVPLTYNKLLLLKDIREIDGYLSIDGLSHTQITDLRFLRRLEVIHGNQTLRLFGRQEYSLVIQNNPHLLTLNLASLCRIENGGVRVNANPHLCLVDTIDVESYLVNSGLARVGGLGQDCTGVYCHEQCEQSTGCWGVFPDECVVCRSYLFMDTCVDSCNQSVSYPVESSMQCLPLTSTTDVIITATPTPPDDIPSASPHHSSAVTSMHHTPFHTETTQARMETMPTNLSSTTPSTAVTGGEGAASYLVLSISVVGGTLILSVVGLLLACILYRQAKKRKEGRASLLPKKGEAAPLIQQCEKSDRNNGDDGVLILDDSGNPDHSTCALRKSHISPSSLSSKSKVQGFVDDTHDQRIGVQTPATDTTLRPRTADTNDTDFRVKSPANINPRISVDSGCYDLEAELNSSSHDDHMITAANHSPFQDGSKCLLAVRQYPRPPSTSSCHSQSSKGVGVQGAKDSTDLGPLFANWKPSMCHNHVSPAMQRPMTMGGVYSTGHHPQHHRNRSRTSNHRGSLTSSYGTGTSTRTSARTSRSTSQQAGSIGCGSGVAASMGEDTFTIKL